MTGRSKALKTSRAALGVRAHSGWAAVILLGGTVDAPRIVERRRIELCDPAIEGSKQPFHQAEPWKLDRAAAYIDRCTKSSRALSGSALGSLLVIAGREELNVAGCCVLTASGRALPDLAKILASHSLIHAAEGEFYRDVVAYACGKRKIAVSRAKERDVMTWTSARLSVSEATLKAKIDALGKPLGPPWTADQKLATAAALLVLAS
jgi:hypothetical protein